MKLIGFDTETSGRLPEYALQPWRAKAGDGWLTCCSVAVEAADGVKAAGKLFPTKDHLASILEKAVSSGAYIAAWNSVFDAAWLVALGLRDLVYKVKWIDGMLLWKHLTNDPEFKIPGRKRKDRSLEAAIAEFFPGEGDFKSFKDFFATDEASLQELLRRNVGDAKYTLMLARRFLSELDELPRTKRCALIEAQCIPQIADTVVDGICIDEDAIANEETGLISKMEAAANLSFVKLKLDNPEVTAEILASPKQLAELLFTTWKLPPVKRTANGQFSTDKDSLTLLADHDSRAKLVRDYREANNLRTKFGDATLESVTYNGDGRTHPQFKIFGTYTGRGTYSSKQGRGKGQKPVGVALHQWKRGTLFRKQITPPEDCDLMEFDFSGQEFRWMGVMSGDEVMLQLCLPGEDAHSYMGSRIAGEDYRDLIARVKAEDEAAGKTRKVGKFGNLSCQYRTSANTLQIRARTDYGLKLSPIEAAAIHSTYQTTYLGVPRYWARQIALGRRQHYVETLGGRRVWLGRPDHWPLDWVWSYESTCINFPIQGVGADQKYLAFMILRDMLPQWNAKVYFELHDGLFVIMPKQHTASAAPKIKHALSNLPYKRAWGVDLPISFPVDCKVGRSWGELHEFETD